MILADFLVREAIITDLQATTKEDAIREIVRSIQNAGYVASVDTETLVKHLQDDGLLTRLRECKTREDVFQLIVDCDRENSAG